MLECAYLCIFICAYMILCMLVRVCRGYAHLPVFASANTWLFVCLFTPLPVHLFVNTPGVASARLRARAGLLPRCWCVRWVLRIYRKCSVLLLFVSVTNVVLGKSCRTLGATTTTTTTTAGGSVRVVSHHHSRWWCEGHASPPQLAAVWGSCLTTTAGGRLLIMTHKAPGWSALTTR